MVMSGGRGGRCAAQCLHYPWRFCDEQNLVSSASPVATGGITCCGGDGWLCSLRRGSAVQSRCSELAATLSSSRSPGAWLAAAGLRWERRVVGITCVRGTRWSKGRSCLWEEEGAGVTRRCVRAGKAHPPLQRSLLSSALRRWVWKLQILTLGTKTLECNGLIFWPFSLALFCPIRVADVISPSWFPTHRCLLPSAAAVTALLPAR